MYEKVGDCKRVKTSTQVSANEAETRNDTDFYDCERMKARVQESAKEAETRNDDNFCELPILMHEIELNLRCDSLVDLR